MYILDILGAKNLLQVSRIDLTSLTGSLGDTAS